VRPAPGLQDLDALGALADPARRRLYIAVCGRDSPVGRDEAAAAAGLSRSLAAYHLDRLAACRLLEVSYGRPPGRGGPGAGRPAKLYRRAEREFVLRAPPRDYALLAEILLRADPEDVRISARKVGRELGRESRSLVEALLARGYEPYDDSGTLRFRNCPFHALADRHRDAVCGLNLALVQGILTGTGEKRRASLEPERAGCCVAVH
jgi:predicted ArsR family transcriptional regulator